MNLEFSLGAPVVKFTCWLLVLFIMKLAFLLETARRPTSAELNFGDSMALNVAIFSFTDLFMIIHLDADCSGHSIHIHIERLNSEYMNSEYMKNRYL